LLLPRPVSGLLRTQAPLAGLQHACGEIWWLFASRTRP